MVAALLYYKKFVKNLRKQGYKINPYDGCIANKMVKGKQIMICFHIDDCKISHESSKVIDDTIDWLRVAYEIIFEDGSGAMKVHCRKVHKYLGMSLDFSHKGQCRVSMYDYVDSILEAFDSAVRRYDDGYLKVGKRHSKLSAAPDILFVVNEDCKKLSDEVAVAFHTIVAKALYVTKQARPDTSLAIAFLTMRVRAPDTDDWEKLCHLMEYLQGDCD
jgi:hypothetical protein